MTAPARPAVPTTPAGDAVPPGDAIDAWLAMLAALLRVPGGERAEITEELEGHLRERVRDLMLAGANEDDAIRNAIAELGEAAALASRFRTARHPPRRRLIMNLSLFALAGGAAALSLFAVYHPAQPAEQPTVIPWQPEFVLDFKPIIRDEHLVLEPNLAIRPWLEFRPALQPDAPSGITGSFENQPLTEVLPWLGQAANRAAQVHWRSLEEGGLARDTTVTLTVADAGIDTILRLVNDQLGLQGPGAIDYRLTDGGLEIAPANYFDRREATLVSYNLSAAMEEEASREEIEQAILNLVEPESWKENGGDAASMHWVGKTLFVQAPPRLQERIQWIVDKLQGRRESALPGGVEGVESIRPRVDEQQLVVQPLAYADAMEIRDTLREVLGVDNASRVEADQHTNSVFVQDGMLDQAVLGRLIKALDKPAPGKN